MAPLIATVLLVLVVPEEAVAAGHWRRPLPGGKSARPFTFERAAPFAGGRRRGMDVAGSPGSSVGAVCGGVVAYAGRVPRWGRGVTLRCADGLVATELGLTSLRVGRGARVVPGTRLGGLASSGLLRVGARRPRDRFGYVDPAPLFGQDADLPRVALAPLVRRPRRTPRPMPAARPARVPHALAPAAPALPPLPILAGAALLASAATGGAARRRRARPRPAPEMATVQR